MAARVSPVFVDTDANNDADLIRRISNNDETALALLYDQYRAFLFGLLFRILQNRSEAEDILQEVFVHVWRQSKKFDEERGKVFTWLVTITHSKAIDRIRFLKTRSRTIEKLQTTKPFYTGLEFEQNLILRQRRKNVHNALSELPENQRSLLLMSYLEGYSQLQIAERTKIPLGTVKTRMRMGIIKLRESLNADQTV